MNSSSSRYALIGHQIAHSLSPAMQLAAFGACGMTATYEALDVPADNLASAVAILMQKKYAGWNVTTPHKERVIATIDVCTATAAATRSVNAVRRIGDGRYEGDDTDGRGLLRALSELWNFTPKDATVLILGSGPAARSSAFELRRQGARAIYCWSRNDEAAARIGPPPSHVVDLCLSALPAHARPPDDLFGFVAHDTPIFDFNYAASTSPVPIGVGGRRSDGLPMLLHQGALSFEWWTGKAAPLDVMRAALGLAAPSNHR